MSLKMHELPAHVIEAVRQVVLTKGERLLIVRRHADMTQAEMAGIFGVAVHRLKLWEHDQRDDAPEVRLTKFGDCDWCHIQRRRQGWLLRDLAAKTGLAAKWLHRAERAERGKAKNVKPLVEWWTQWLLRASEECSLAFREVEQTEELLS